ncbi:unnamed protein product [Ascophyllum nodosum]
MYREPNSLPDLTQENGQRFTGIWWVGKKRGMQRLRSAVANARQSGKNASIRRLAWAPPRACCAASADQAAEATAQLMSLEEVRLATDLAGRGLRSQAVPFLERAVEICAGSMGEGSAITRAALHRLALVLYDDGRFGAAEATLLRGASSDGKALPPETAEILLLSKAQLFQGKVSAAVGSCSAAVDLLQKDNDHTPDTEALGRALRQLGATQMLDGGEEDAETSLLRAARLGSTAAAQAKGLAALAAFNTARGDERSVEEAVDLWTEACSTSPDEEDERDGSDSGDERGAVGGEGDGASSAGTSGNDAFRLARASVLCSSAQGEMILRRGTATASERLGEALKIREELLPSGHPATAWTLGLLARCHLEAGEAVTAEGLFRAALDGLKGVVEEEGDGGGFSERQGQGAGSAVVLFPSPLHPYSRAATLKAYAGLLSQWENREGEGGIAARRADTVQSALPLKPPGDLTIHMLHLDDTY